MKNVINNIKTLLNDNPHREKLIILYNELLGFMVKNDWRGACHESCGVQYVLLNELGINCIWKLGEVKSKNFKIQGKPIYFDHSWILIDDEIFDLAIHKTNYPPIDSYPTIRNLNSKTLLEPEFNYNTESGWGDDIYSQKVKNTPLACYFNNSPMHEKLGTWMLILQLGKKLGLSLNVVDMRNKYNGIYWK